jgi:hypothetical protein
MRFLVIFGSVQCVFTVFFLRRVGTVNYNTAVYSSGQNISSGHCALQYLGAVLSKEFPAVGPQWS